MYRYGPGQFFDQHYDDSNNLTLHGTADGPTAVAAKTTWTLLLYLTSAADGECEGGETVFYPDGPAARGFKKGGKGGGSDPELAVVPETGMLLLHKHGEDCLLVSTWQLCCRRNYTAPFTNAREARGQRSQVRGEVDSENRFVRQEIKSSWRGYLKGSTEQEINFPI